MNLRQLQNTESAAGKTVKEIITSLCSEQVMILFTDDTFVLFGATPGYECVNLEFKRNFNVFEFGTYLLIGNGILSKEEADRLTCERDAVEKKRKEEWDRANYERLKKQFETSKEST